MYLKGEKVNSSRRHVCIYLHIGSDPHPTPCVCYFVSKILSHPILYFQNVHKKYNDLINFLRMKRDKVKPLLSLSPSCI